MNADDTESCKGKCWSYRIIRHTERTGDYLALHEVVYDENHNSTGVTVKPVDFISALNGEGEEWARQDLIDSLRRALRHLEDFPEVLGYELFEVEKADKAAD